MDLQEQQPIAASAIASAAAAAIAAASAAASTTGVRFADEFSLRLRRFDDRFS